MADFQRAAASFAMLCRGVVALWVLFVSLNCVGCVNRAEHAKRSLSSIDWAAEMQKLVLADTSEKQIAVLKNLRDLQNIARNRSIPIPAWLKIPLDADGKGLKEVKAYGDIKAYLVMDGRTSPAFPPVKIRVFDPTSQSHISATLRRFPM